MQMLFSEAGQRRMQETARAGILCAFDFDGTLAPIVSIPDEARLPAHVKPLLLRLGELAPIAVITGRSIEDILARLDFKPDFLVGNHGMEGVPGRESAAAGHERLCALWRSQLERALQDVVRDPGVQVEDKRYSLSVHYRLAKDPDRAARTLQGILARLDPPARIVAGKFVFNVVAEDAYHKGDALAHLMEYIGARSAVYAGDDVTDEDVFRLKRPDILSVRVEAREDSGAEFFLPHQADIVPFLERLIELLEETGARNWVRPDSD